ncbi:hypothetical protein MNBD_NITROSPINAE03-1186 [hydrothermal vent metagenome]|uniref:Uncharacterized protein n=1 Tax=hydrothermal vent metagenome TaxID=652676 RepID=A0A3B1CAG6_9ZZZZ
MIKLIETRLIFVLALASTLAMTTNIAEARHLKLYTYDIPEVGATQVTYTFDQVNSPKAGYQTGSPTLHEVEIERTITEHWLQSFYVDYDYAPPTDGYTQISEVSSLKTEFNFTFSEKGRRFVDFRMNVELAKAMNNKITAYGEKGAADTAEFRFIFEKNFNLFTIVLGPMLVKDIAGPAELSGWTYGYANAILIDISDRVGFGLEFHGSMGEARDLGFPARQNHTIVPNFDIAVTRDLTLSLGAGFGLTNVTDNFTFRTAIQYVFGPGGS